MANFKYVLPILAVMVAVVTAFAFNHNVEQIKPVRSHEQKIVNVWLKYDCSNPGQVSLNEPTGTNIYLNAEDLCPSDAGVKCAEEYISIDDLEEVPDHSGYFRPKSVNPVTPLNTLFCP